MKPTLKLLALLFAGVINLQAQEPSKNETAWSELLIAKNQGAATSPEAIAIRDSIVASDTITRAEANIVAGVTKANEGQDAYISLFRNIANSSKRGEGAAMAHAVIKHLERDLSGWTEEMMTLRPDLAASLATHPQATPEFQDRAWAIVKNQGAHSSRRFFKWYRAKLPKAEQIEVTRRQKEFMLAIPTRNEAANAWLAEISADLIALQLDQ